MYIELSKDKPVIRFISGCNELGKPYFEPGILGRIVGANKQDDGYLLAIIFHEFNLYNKRFETKRFDNKTAREVGYFKPIDLFFIKGSYSDYFQVLSSEEYTELKEKDRDLWDHVPYTGD